MKITLDHLTRRFPGRGKNAPDVIAVNDFTFEIPDGKLVALLGPSGCGKSTVLNLISGLLKVSGGSVYFDEDDVTRLPPEHRRHQRAAGVALAAWQQFNQGIPADAATLTPNYLRLSQAERERLAREEKEKQGESL